jgi:hypothetical protein
LTFTVMFLNCVKTIFTPATLTSQPTEELGSMTQGAARSEPIAAVPGTRVLPTPALRTVYRVAPADRVDGLGFRLGQKTRRPKSAFPRPVHASSALGLL